MAELLPNGMVRLDDGNVIKREDVAYRLRKFKDDPSIKIDSKGNWYKEDEKGTLRKIKPIIQNGIYLPKQLDGIK